MNKTTVWLSISALLALGLGGVILLLAINAEGADKLISLIPVLLTATLGAAVTLYGVGKVSEQAEVIKRQTNGINTRLQDANDALTRVIVDEAIATKGQTGPVENAKETN